MKHVFIRVSGKVQGVFFRASTQEKAEELQIKGTVRNNADGSVSIEAEGDEQSLSQFIKWCEKGPKFAHVDRCEVQEKALQHFKTFSIER